MLAAGCPEHAAFMSDEGVGSVPGLTPIQYTARHYHRYLDRLLERTAQLNQGEALDRCPDRLGGPGWSRLIQAGPA